MNETDWDQAIRQLSEAADHLGVLARCLAIGPDLDRWRSGEEVAGMLAADALDQARGDLERLSAGEAATLLELVKRLLEELPGPLE